MKTLENNKKDEDKKIISEFVKIFSDATKYRKVKKFKKASDKYLQCYTLIENTDLIDKQCETTFYLGQCYLKLNKINEGYIYLLKSNEQVDLITITSFPYDKIKGKVSAQMILLHFAINSLSESIAYAKNIVHHIEGIQELIDKMKIYYYFIKELLSFMKNNKKIISFFNDYESAKNEIIFNNENTISPSLISTFNTLMNSSTKTNLLQKNDIMYYNVKYELSSNHPLITFMDKNSDLIKDSNNQRVKSSIDSFIKTNKIKLNVLSIDLIQEQKKRIDCFNDIFCIISGSFNQIFKNFFSISKLNIEITMGNENHQKIDSPNSKPSRVDKMLMNVHFINNEIDLNSSVKPFSASNKNNSRRRSQYEIENINNYRKNKDGLTPNNKGNSISPKKTNLFNKKATSFASTNRNNNNTTTVNTNKTTETKAQNQIILLCDNMSIDTKTDLCDNYNNNYHKNLNQYIPDNIENKKTPGVKKNKYDEEKNNYDHSRIENISTANDPAFDIKRKRNIILFQTIIDELSKGKQIRDCDILPTKIQSYIKNYSMLSLEGNHKTFGENISVNQDICFCYDNFLLLRNLYFFGVCDGHGDLGHLVSEHAKIYIPANIQYIEFDDYLIKKNKNIHNLIASLYTVNEKSTVKDVNIIKYFYDKFSINQCDTSLYKKTFHDINNVLKEAFKQTHEDLLKRNFDSQSSGSTACTLLINGKRIFLANIGDSRAILCSCNTNSNWKVSQLTKDHKPNDREEKDRIITANGKIKRLFNEDNTKEIGPYRVWFQDETNGPGLAMSRSLGDTSAKEIGVLAEPDIYEYCLNSNDKFIIIASDGVWEYITCEEALDIVKDVYLDYSKTGVDACEALTKKATQKWQKVYYINPFLYNYL